MWMKIAVLLIIAWLIVISPLKRKERKQIPPQWGDNVVGYKGFFNLLPTFNCSDEQDILLNASFCQNVNKKYATYI